MRASGVDAAPLGEKRKQKKINIDEAEGNPPSSPSSRTPPSFGGDGELLASALPRTNCYCGVSGVDAAVLHVETD